MNFEAEIVPNGIIMQLNGSGCLMITSRKEQIEDLLSCKF